MRLKLAAALPDLYFRCQTYGCDLSFKDCIRRQMLRGESGGGNRKGQFKRVYVPEGLEWCASGRCEQGRKVQETHAPEAQPEVKIKRRGCA